MTTTLKIHPFSMPLTELSAIIHFLTGVRDERMGPAGIAPSELLTPEEKAALLTPPADECGTPFQLNITEECEAFSVGGLHAAGGMPCDPDLFRGKPSRVFYEQGYEKTLELAKAKGRSGDFDPAELAAFEAANPDWPADDRYGSDVQIRASAGGDQQPYAVKAGGSDDFAELREETRVRYWHHPESSCYFKTEPGSHLKDQLDSLCHEVTEEEYLANQEQTAEEAFAPKPPALPVAPAAPGTTAPTSSPAGSVTVDKDGLPWDERIHSGSKATNADGTWRKKRGVDAALVTEVEAQLGKLMAPEVPAAPKPPVPPVPGSVSTAAPAPAAPPVPPPPAPVVTAPAGPSSPAPAASTAEPQAAQAVTFASLFKRVTELKKANDGKTFPGEDDILTALGQPTWLAIASAKDQALIEAAWGLLP